MKKSIFLFFAAILCSMSIDAYAATQRYIYVGLSNNYHKWKNESQWGINHWGGTGGGVVPGSKITDLKTTFTHSGCTFHMYRMYVYDDNKNFEFKGNDSWWDCKKENISISGTTKNAILFRDNDGGDGGSPTFYQTDYQEESTVSLSASSTAVSVGEEVTLTPMLTSNADYNDITSTTYSVGTGATVSDGKFVATTAGTYTVTATITYNPKKFTGITKKVENVTCEIVVSEVAVPHPVTGVTVAPTSVTIKQGATATLTATVSPANADDPSITWSSDNTSVATVVNGVVTAVAAGTANITVTTVDGEFTATCAVKVKPLQYTFYAINSAEWPTVAAHYWGGADGGSSWPGADMVKESETINGFDIYSITISSDFVNIMFTNQIDGDKNKKTADLTTEGNNGKYYDIKDAKWYASLSEVPVLDPLATDVYLAGAMTDWDTNKKEFKKATAEATSASVTVNLTAKNYEFKLIIDGDWKGNDGTMKRGGDAVHEGGWSFDGGNNCNIVADIAGDYTFTWDLNTKKLTVAYPPLPKYTVTATAENGSVTGAGEYEHGSEATLVATPNTGYAFKNWTKGGEEVSTEATYTFTVTANVELVANFVPEETHEVTVSYLCNGTPIPGQTTQTLAVGVTTPSTITAPAITHYTFDGWTLGTGVQSEDATTANPIQITTLGSGEYTLAANYTKIELTYTVEVPAGTEKCFIRGGFDGWDKFHEMELKDGETNVFTLTIDGAVETDEYKYACQASWDYKELDKEGNDIANRTWTALDKVEKWGKPVIVTYQLKGVGGWEQPGIELVQNPGNDKEYMLTCQAISATDAIKVVRLEDGVIKDYYGNGTVKDEVTVAVSYDGEANIKLPEGKYNFYFDTNASEKKLWIEAATDCGPATITLTTGDNSAVIAANIDKTVNVKIERSFTANDGYYTLCVPFKMDPSVIGKAYSLGTITEHVVGEGININLEEETYMLSAGMPYLILPKANMSELIVENVTIETDEAYGQNVTNGEGTVNIFFQGYYSASGQTNGSTEYYVGEHGYLYNGVVDIRGLSGLFTITDENGAPLKVRARVVTREDEATGFENITNGENTTIKVIENGQLIIIRGGEKFNAQGQKL